MTYAVAVPAIITKTADGKILAAMPLRPVPVGQSWCRAEMQMRDWNGRVHRWERGHLA